MSESQQNKKQLNRFTQNYGIICYTKQVVFWFKRNKSRHWIKVGTRNQVKQQSRFKKQPNTTSRNEKIHKLDSRG